MRMVWSAVCLGLICCLHTAIAAPIATRDLNPLLAGYELPPALPSRQPLAPTLSAQFAIGNISLDQQAANESLQLDGELQRWELAFSTALNKSLSVRVEVPYLRISGGRLDGFIESFHSAFGLPNGNRDTWPTHRLWIEHRTSGQRDFALSTAQHGIGDVTLRIAKHFNTQADAEPAFNHSLWVSLKLPTGDAQSLTGSDSVDAAVSWSSSLRLGQHTTTHQQLSMSWLGQGDRLSDQQRKIVWSGTLGMQFAVTPRWSALAQLQGHTPVFDSELRGLGNALQLSLGPRYQAGAWRCELIISEDIAVDTSPDVQFMLGITRRY